MNTAVRMVYPFLPLFGRGLEVDLQMLSLALTLRSASGVFGPFLASIGDSRGRKSGMLLGLFLFISGIVALLVWPNYWTFAAMLILTVTGNFVFIPSMQAYLGDQVPYQRRGLVLGLTEFGWSLSFIAGVPLVGLLIERYGWQAPFPWLAALGVVAFLGLMLILPRQEADSVKTAGTIGSNLWRVFRNKAALAGLLFGFALSSSNEVINLVFGVWLEDTFQVQISGLAAASLVIGLSELGGEGLVSFLSDKAGKTRLVFAGLAINGLAALALPWFGSNLTGALWGLFLLYISFELTLVGSLPVLTEVLPAARATFMATVIASMALGRAFGALLSPHLYQMSRTSGLLSGLIFTVAGALALDLVALGALQILNKNHA